VGTSELTAQVAAAHTGSLVGDDKVFDAACRELGVIRVQSIEDLVITSAVLAHTGPLAIPGVAIVSISGGACTLIADRAEFYGVSLPGFSAATKSLLTAALPSAIDPLNPFDITGVAIRDPALFETVLAAVGADPAIGFVGCVYSMPWNEKWERVPQIESIGRALKLLNKPSAMLNQTLRPLTRKSRDIIEETGVPAVFGGLEDVVRALGRVSLWTKQLESINLTSAKSVIQLSNEHPDSERATCAFLASFGVPVIKSKLVTAKEEAVAFAEMLNEPVAMKISSPDILHKTEVGGVVLNIAEPAAITAAYDQILTSVRSAAPAARIEGILMSPMRVGGLELLVGTVRDAQWGPVIAVGLGGVLVEVLADTELHLLPVTPLQVRGMLTRLRGAKLLFGFRGMPAVDLDRLTEVIACIGDAALALGPELETLEVNPLWIRGSQIEALDGLAIWSSDKSIQH
jgi:acyl-CoA synthetase (NDP forming)